MNLCLLAAAQSGILPPRAWKRRLEKLGNENKHKGRVTPHSFRATFRTICSQHKAELLGLGISKEVIESTLTQKRTILQWYEDYLNGIEDLGFD